MQQHTRFRSTNGIVLSRNAGLSLHPPGRPPAIHAYPRRPQQKHPRGTLLPVAVSSAAAPGAWQSGREPTPPITTAIVAPAGPTAEQIAQQIVAGGQVLRRFGWVSFWVQLPLHVTSSILQLFTAMFTAKTTTSAATHVFILASTLIGGWCLLQTFGFVSLGRKLARYATNLQGQRVEKIRKTEVLNTLWRGVLTSMWGLGCAVLGLQALVGTFFWKILLAGPFGASDESLTIDVLVAQAGTNAVIAHFAALAITTWVYDTIMRSHA